tara:strand:- start:5870 stop:6367 length:498 start_codon:yes stop_codon:yes gene_type:complete
MSQSSSSSSASCAARAHWTIYLPSLLIAACWVFIYVLAVRHEPVRHGLRALALAVEGLIVPVLVLFAAVRARILLVEVRTGPEGLGLYVRSGFVRAREVSIGAREVASVRVRRGWVHLVFGGGALDIRTLSGERIFVNDLDHPQRIAAALVVPVQSEFGHEEKLQ